MLKSLAIFCLGFVSTGLYASEKTVTFCVDNNIWFPYIMTDKTSGEGTGVTVDMAKEVLAQMKLKGSFKSTPWRRCTEEKATSNGEFDGIISPSYKEARAKFINYPKDAENEKGACTSPYNAVCAKYVFAITKSDAYEYEDKVETLPQPIRAPNGYSVVEDINKELKKAGKPEIELGVSDEKNLQKLVRDNKGVVIIDGRVAENLMDSKLPEHKEFKEKLRILKKPYAEKSNYIAFYKSSKNMTEAQQAEFQEKLAALLKNKSAVDKLYAKPAYGSDKISEYK